MSTVTLQFCLGGHLSSKTSSALISVLLPNAGHRGRESVHPTLSALRWRVIPAQELLLHSHPGRTCPQAFQNGSVDRHRPPGLNHALPTAPTSVASASHLASPNQLLPTSLPAGVVTNAVFYHCNVHCPTSRATNPTRSTD